MFVKITNNAIDGTPCAVKVARTVWSGGKLGDYLKGLPITIELAEKAERCQQLLGCSALRYGAAEERNQGNAGRFDKQGPKDDVRPCDLGAFSRYQRAVGQRYGNPAHYGKKASVPDERPALAAEGWVGHGLALRPAENSGDENPDHRIHRRTDSFPGTGNPPERRYLLRAERCQ